MEPVSAISVAAATLQVLDFGARLLSASHQIYRSPSGCTSKQVALSTIAGDLSRLLDQVEHVTTGNISLSPAQDQLVKLGAECKTLLAPLGKALDRLQDDRGSGFTFTQTQTTDSLRSEKGLVETFRSALGAVWNQADIDKKMKELEDMRQRMAAAAIFTLWYVTTVYICLEQWWWAINI